MEEETTTAFNKAKEALAKATLLNHPKPSSPTSITTDASDIAVGAVLQQFVDGVWCPISYFSKKLQPSETQYSTFDRELLAVYLSIKHFRHFVEGRDFHIRTDQKPLTFAMGTRPDRQSPRQSRQLDFISQFTSDIRYVKGSENTAADALSRITINSASSTIDFQAIALAQQSSLAFKQILLLSTFVPFHYHLLIICDMSSSCPRPYIPESFRRSVFDSLHGLSHPGIRATQKLLTSRLIWPSINTDVRKWTRTCLQCQRSKVHRHNTAPLATFTTPDNRFDMPCWTSSSFTRLHVHPYLHR